MLIILLFPMIFYCQKFSEKGYGGGFDEPEEEENAMDHVNTTIKKEKGDENYTAKLVKRKHNSHSHKEGGAADKAYYTYYSYHPSSRHSEWSFHEFQHGTPKSWGVELSADAKSGRRIY